MVLSLYNLGLVLAGLGVIGLALLSRVIADRPVSLPVVYLLFGAVVFSLPLGLPDPDPTAHADLAERLSELGVTIALMGAGLRLDRGPGWPEWQSTARLLAVTMPLTIAAAVALGWWVVGFAAPTAMLLGAVIAPTDPVLASEVEVENPGEGQENEPVPEAEGMGQEIKFALTSEAGLNDSLAFPFTYLAILFALVGVAPENWVGQWALVYVGYKLAVGLAAGLVMGWVLGWVVFASEAKTQLSQSLMGIEALGGTLLIYGATELLNGYGFLAVFVAALIVRYREREAEYNRELHDVAEMTEYLLMVVIVVLFGGAVASGLLDPLTVELVAVALALVFLVRPLAGAVGLLGFDRDWKERGAIAFFGIRGIGSFYYLAYGLNHAPFPEAEVIWALVGCVTLISIVVHGITATPVVARLERS